MVGLHHASVEGTLLTKKCNVSKQGPFNTMFSPSCSWFWCVCRLDEETQYRGLDPLLLIESARRLERARWHPTNGNLFATVACSDRSVWLYDAEYTQVESNTSYI